MKNDSADSNVFWLKDSGNNPVTLVAWLLKGTKIRYATATHNPPDVFNRVHAHNKALGRLRQGRDLTCLIPLDAVIGPEATIAKHIIKTQRGDPELSAPRIHVAAKASLKMLVARHKRRAKQLASDVREMIKSGQRQLSARR